MTCPSGKVRFPDQHAAQLALVDAAMARNRGKAKRRECRTYQCETCGAWHLTSHPTNPRRTA